MSKKPEQKPAEEEEWEDVEENEDEEEAEEEEDTSLNNSNVVMKYKRAGQWCNEVMQEVLKLVKPGASVLEICKAGDKAIDDRCQKMFREEERGIAFPTSISINSCVCHNSPEEGDKTVLALNDLIRIDLGIHISGYSAHVAQTVHVTEDGKLNPESREAQAIAGAHATLDAALRQLRPGVNVYDVTEVIEGCAKNFGLTPIDGVLSHEIKRYVPDSYKAIPGKDVAEHKVHNYNIDPLSVWGMDIVLTTGKGTKLKERDAKPSVFKVAIDQEYQPKLTAAADVQKEIDEKFQTFPFATRNSTNKKCRLGISELVKHQALHPFPVLYEKDGEIVVQFKATAMIMPKKIERVTGLPPQEGAPKPAPYTDEAIAAAAKQPFSLVDKKKKNEESKKAEEAQ